MKITFLLCLAVVLTGCSKPQEAPPPKIVVENPAKKAKNNPDSPILISDNSTHLKHKGSASDLQISSNGSGPQVTVYDPGYAATSLECAVGVSCPNGNAQIPLAKGWTIVAFDDNVTKTVTISSLDNLTIVGQFYVSTIKVQHDTSQDTGSSDVSGTDVFQEDAAHKFSSAKFTNGAGATVCPNGCTLTCSSSPCKLKIHYHN